MQRVIYQVSAMIVDANGTFNNLSGYPKIFDSRTYDNDIEKAYQRAEGDCYDVLGDMGKRDDRQFQIACIIRINDGLQMFSKYFGRIADIPEPEQNEGE